MLCTNCNMTRRQIHTILRHAIRYLRFHKALAEETRAIARLIIAYGKV